MKVNIEPWNDESYSVTWNLEGKMDVKKKDVDLFLSTVSRIERFINAEEWKVFAEKEGK